MNGPEEKKLDMEKPFEKPLGVLKEASFSGPKTGPEKRKPGVEKPLKKPLGLLKEALKLATQLGRRSY